MFNRLQLRASTEELADWAGVDICVLCQENEERPPIERPRYPVLRLRPQTGERELVWMQVGLVPSYAHDERGAELRTEASAEAITCSSGFRTTFRRRRCLVPATQLSEHGHSAKGTIQDCSFAPTSGQILSVAAVWETWINDAGCEVETFAVITSLVAPVLRSLFDRLPIVISLQERDRWLHSSTHDPEPLDLLRPLSAPELKTWKMMPYDQSAPALDLR
ncbi:putative SOS response-associated peptidase YedK [Edaphobacter modestus]|uniref:Abasic site processing protein n=1 Tax=Edaphobacter modestus TaxID=388466 RepID=A0A4Q7YWU8_9BACT|nr:putative SOS response-associated peptidase YedK [Edaphobacter modestus]